MCDLRLPPMQLGQYIENQLWTGCSEELAAYAGIYRCRFTSVAETHKCFGVQVYSDDDDTFGRNIPGIPL